MARINVNRKVGESLKIHPDATENYEGGLAFQMDAKNRLYTRVASCLWGETKFYGKENEDGTREKNQDKELLADLNAVSSENPEFILRLASYARNELYL